MSYSISCTSAAGVACSTAPRVVEAATARLIPGPLDDASEAGHPRLPRLGRDRAGRRRNEHQAALVIRARVGRVVVDVELERERLVRRAGEGLIRREPEVRDGAQRVAAVGPGRDVLPAVWINGQQRAAATGRRVVRSVHVVAAAAGALVEEESVLWRGRCDDELARVEMGATNASALRYVVTSRQQLSERVSPGVRKRGRWRSASTSVISTCTAIPTATSSASRSMTLLTRKTPSSSRTTTAP
jgi:hypothetical protein